MKLTSFSAQKISEILGGSHVVVNPYTVVTNLLIDSRKGRQFESSLFIALDGEFRNGHRFVGEMYKKGVRNFLVSQPVPNIPKANVFLVNSTIDSLQKLAIYQRESTDIPVIGVTGSNGKTIVKEWLFQLLKNDFKIMRSPKSYNSQIGVALSVWAMNLDYNLAIFEAGISKMNEMVKLQKMVQPSIGILTNIGTAHQENFTSQEEKLNEKLALFADSEYLIYHADNEMIDQRVKHAFSNKKRLSWGLKEGNYLQILGSKTLSTKTIIYGSCLGEKVEITIPFLDDASIENAIHCWVVLLYYKITPIEIKKRFEQLESVAMRLEQKNGLDNSILIDDAYNSDITAFEIALDNLSQVNRRIKTVILSDILQSGQTQETLYKRINQSLLDHKVTRFIGIGKDLFEHQHLIEVPDKHFFVHTQHFTEQIHAFNFQNNSILIKGARSFRFERISAKLASKTHETQLEINLDALKNNLRFYRKKLTKGAKLMVMVKASGYGAGGPEVARLLASEEVDYLGVAYADEGVTIRKAGISTPIMVMNPSSEAFSIMINYDLEPEIYSVEALEAFNQALNAEGMMNSTYKIHLKVDTGMNRLGFKEEDIDEVLALLKRKNYVKVASVFSHFAASDEAKFDDFTIGQISQFTQISDKIEKNLGYSFIRHICNTAGLERFPEAHFDMARLGLGLYGVAIAGKNKNKVRVVSSLFSIVVQIKNVHPGESIGYGRKFIVQKEMQIAIIPIGYADGLNRKLGNGNGKVFVSGHKRPIVGNICMDVIMVDVTGLSTQVNDRVEIFGNKVKIQELAEKAETISYEILASIPIRVKRMYIKEDS